jgi:hypothetical protein
MAREIIARLRNIIDEIPTDKRVSQKLEIGSRCYICALIKVSNKGYKTYVLPSKEDEVLTYWIDDKYDEISEQILHHYRSDITFVYDNGIRSVDYNGEATYEEDVEDTLYIQVNSTSELEREFNTIEKVVTRITPHIDAITANIYDVMANTGVQELVATRVLGYKVTDVNTVVGELHSDWRSNQLLGNLIELDTTV